MGNLAAFGFTPRSSIPACRFWPRLCPKIKTDPAANGPTFPWELQAFDFWGGRGGKVLVTPSLEMKAPSERNFLRLIFAYSAKTDAWSASCLAFAQSLFPGMRKARLARIPMTCYTA